MSTNDGGIDMMRFPVQFPGGIGVGLHRGEEAVPDPGLFPAIEPGGDGGGGPIAGGQVGPGRAGAQDPEDAVDDRPVVVARAAPLAALDRTAGLEQGFEPRPLCVS